MKLFKRKAFYIVLLVLFTLLLAATLILRFAVAGSGRVPDSPGTDSLPEGFDGSGFSGSFGGFRPGSGSDGSDSGSQPEGFDPENLPEGFDGSGFPGGPGGFRPGSGSDGSDSGSRPEGFDPENLPESFDGSGFPGNGFSRQRGGFLAWVRSWWLPIGITCVLIDALCILMLIRLSRKKRRAQDPVDGAQDGENDDEPRRSKKALWLLLLIPLIGAGVALKLMSDNTATDVSSVNVEENVLTAEVSAGEIQSVYLSGGSLEAEPAQTVSLPGEIRIASFAVENGTLVEEGDLIATVEKASVLSAIREMQELMTQLDHALAETSEQKDTDQLTAPAAGRVMAIYAESGTPVVNTMSQHGALVILSLDGLMSCEIPDADGLQVGDSLCVVLPDGSEEPGRVASVQDGSATVTFSDTNVQYGDTVTVRDAEGNTVCTAEPAIHSELRITGYQGLTEEISAAVGDTVSVGDTVLTLKNTEHSPEYSELSAQREQLSEQMCRLFALYQTGELRAESAGEITGLNEDLVSLRASGAGYYVTLLVNSPVEDASETGVVNYCALVVSREGQTLSLKAAAEPLGEIDYTRVSELDPQRFTNDTESTLPAEATVFTWDGAQWQSGTLSDIKAGDVLVLGCDASGALLWIVRAPAASAPPEDPNPEAPTSDDPTPEDPATDVPATDNPTPEDPTPDVPATDSPTPDAPDPGGLTSDDPTSNPDGPAQQQLGGQSPGTSSGPSASGDPGVRFPSSFPGGSGSTQPSSGAGIGSDAQLPAAGSQEKSSYTITETGIYRLTPHDTVSIEISVDELDIRSLRIGQAVTVTLDALPGQSFAGELVSVNTEGTYDSGNTKYAVTICLERTEQMLSGMNAGIRIELADPTACLVLPEAALVEKGGKTYVYTSYDPQSDTLGGLTQIQTGAADGTNAQIVDGLTEGDTVYYRYADSITYSFIPPI